MTKPPEPRGEARIFQLEFVEYMKDHGFRVQMEVKCTYGPYRASGRIDVLATDRRDGYRIAYELDYKVPAKKSIAKLQEFPCDEAWIICRTMKAYRIK